jgi:WD40 repeat protein
VLRVTFHRYGVSLGTNVIPMTTLAASHVRRMAAIPTTTAVRALAWSHDRRHLVAADLTGAFRVWEMVDGEPRLRLTRQLNGSPLTVSWSFDDQYVAFGLGSSGVEIWDIVRVLRVWPTLYADVSDDVSCVAWGPSDLRLAFGGTSGTVFFRAFNKGWDRPDDQVGIGHEFKIESLIWAPHGGRLVTGTSGGSLGIWNDSDVDNQLRDLLSVKGIYAHDEPILALAWSERSDTLASASRDKCVRLWDMRERRNVGVLTLEEIPLHVAFALEGRILVVRCLDNIRFFRVSSLAEITAYRLDGSLDPHPTPTSFDGHSQIASVDNSTNHITILDVDVVGLLRFSEITSRPYRAAAVAVLGEARSGRTSTVSALTDEASSTNSLPHSLHTGLLRLPRLLSPTSEETRDLALWDLPSG